MKKSIITFLFCCLLSCTENTSINQNTEKVSSAIILKNDVKVVGKPNFNVSKPVTLGNRNAYISLFFKDEFKIRLQGLDSISFKSLANKDTNKLNDLLVKYNTKKLEPHEQFYLKSEEELEKEEKASEKFYGVDYPNKGSIYTLYVENADVKAFIEELRKNEYVLSANENTG